MMTRVIVISGFVVCGIVLALLALDGRRENSKLMPFGSLLDRVMASRVARITLVLFWWWLGWHFLVLESL